jgi:hypothetical protein
LNWLRIISSSVMLAMNVLIPVTAGSPLISLINISYTGRKILYYDVSQ